MPTRLPILRERAIALGAIAAVGLILALRKPDSLQNPQFFAEDGTVFFIGARQLGAAAILTPYGGYLNLVPRLLAAGAAVFDPLWIPALYNGAALFLDVAAIAILFSRRVRLPAKPALALAFALVPHTGEVFLSLTNLQWCLAIALLLLLLMDDAATAWQRLFDTAVLAICGLTGPFICLLFPLFAIRAAARRTRESVLLAALAGLAAGVQLGYLYGYRHHFDPPTMPHPHGLMSSMAGRLYGTFWMGYGIQPISPGILWIALGIAATAAVGWLSLRRGDWKVPRRMLALAWLCLVIPVALKFRHDAVVIGLPANGDRYFVLPHLLLAWLLVIGCVELKGWRRLLPAALLGASLAFNLHYMRAAPLPDLAWAAHVQPIRDGDPFEIPINPVGRMMVGRAMGPQKSP